MKDENKSPERSFEIDKTIQSIRTLTTSQIRKQLDYDLKKRPDRFTIVGEFFKDASYQMK